MAADAPGRKPKPRCSPEMGRSTHSKVECRVGPPVGRTGPTRRTSGSGPGPCRDAKYQAPQRHTTPPERHCWQCRPAEPGAGAERYPRRRAPLASNGGSLNMRARCGLPRIAMSYSPPATKCSALMNPIASDFSTEKPYAPELT